MELSVIIINYRTPGLVVDCLASLAAEKSTVDFSVVVVENGSQDNSSEILAQHFEAAGWSDWVKLVVSTENLGFSGGNNLGFKHVPFVPYILLLNSDTIVHPGCLRKCVDVLKANPRIGAMSCKLLNSDGSIQNVARRLPHPFRITLSRLGFTRRWPKLFGWANLQDPYWDRETECRPVGWLGGAFLMIPRHVIDTIGLLDEEFFFYGEDVEFCHRVRKAGFLLWYEASVTTTHFGAGSSDESRLPRGEKNERRIRARYLTQRKLYGRWAEMWVWTLDACMDRLGNTIDHLRKCFRKSSNTRSATRNDQ
ncbi:MAG: glycosyltransferase family 2 protein [Planctomyces sp.]|nr:glycosyltransferase family 2 protein [Planctomyces sp.]